MAAPPTQLGLRRRTHRSRPGRRGSLGQESGAFQFSGGLMQPHRRRDDLIMPRLRRAGDERVCPPTRHHVPAVGRSDGPSQAYAVDEQRLAHPGRPGRAGVSATIDNTTSPHRQPPSQPAPNRMGCAPAKPNATNTCSGGGSTFTPVSLVEPIGVYWACIGPSTSPCRAASAWPTRRSHPAGVPRRRNRLS